MAAYVFDKFSYDMSVRYASRTLKTSICYSVGPGTRVCVWSEAKGSTTHRKSV
jgi:hypothetical protein